MHCRVFQQHSRCWKVAVLKMPRQAITGEIRPVSGEAVIGRALPATARHRVRLS